MVSSKVIPRGTSRNRDIDENAWAVKQWKRQEIFSCESYLYDLSSDPNDDRCSFDPLVEFIFLQKFMVTNITIVFQNHFDKDTFVSNSEYFIQVSHIIWRHILWLIFINRLLKTEILLKIPRWYQYLKSAISEINQLDLNLGCSLIKRKQREVVWNE